MTDIFDGGCYAVVCPKPSDRRFLFDLLRSKYAVDRTDSQIEGVLHRMDNDVELREHSAISICRGKYDGYCYEGWYYNRPRYTLVYFNDIFESTEEETDDADYGAAIDSWLSFLTA